MVYFCGIEGEMTKKPPINRTASLPVLRPKSGLIPGKVPGKRKREALDHYLQHKSNVPRHTKVNKINNLN